ncbi:sugar phosphate nucleotidyltransferase [Rhodospirillum centenum]|uniref:glucose-1-phosphate thymidylyltransferase n=1 Tax=Rhodospirillum centenum (strain ATCC 51521 / SW) TaxID=414684 RepID=B6IRW6_RHOCS|nr:sugar phosphate nucleotidyltransferase [Rhodospirillum centenum]ACI98202.1 glucose-1-phosphate thymidylyltransferase, putative [Rhodospirillum centenum SW]
MWGIVPAAGNGTRIQPLAFSKELLPVGSRLDGETERPRAVSEYLLERMVLGGADKLCMVISPGKSDILEYYGGSYGTAAIAYVVQPRPGGLCDALFRALPLVGPDEPVIVGLPDTVWFPEHALRALPEDDLSFLLFPVDRPELFDAVVLTPEGVVQEIQVKRADAASRWIWGAFRMPGRVFRELHQLWRERDRRDEYVGTLVNAWIARGGRALGVRAGEAYVDVGTVHGYRAAIGLLAGQGDGRGSGLPPRERTEAE